MVLQLDQTRLDLENELQLSFYVKNRKGKDSKVAFAKLLDISEAGLCMEISPLDSDLFMEVQDTLYILSKTIAIQLFCRSHDNNVSIEGEIKWFKRKSELYKSCKEFDICAGVLFSIHDSQGKKEVIELMRHLGGRSSNCHSCSSIISTQSAFCHSCGSRLAQKRSLLKNVIFGLLNGNES